MSYKLKIITVFLLISQAGLFAQDAREIVKKANELIRSKGSYSKITMEIIKPDWSRKMEMEIWALEPDYSMLLITRPAKNKGYVTLKRKKEVWNWIPSVRRVIKIPPSMMLQSWMGSDFTNDDLVRQSSIVDDCSHEIIGSEVIDGYQCHKIQLIPKPEAGVVWGKILMWVSQKEFLQLKADHFDEDGELIKTMVGSKVKVLGGRLIPTYWEMIPVNKPGQKTVMEYLDIRFNMKLKTSFFSQQNMKKVR